MGLLRGVLGAVLVELAATGATPCPSSCSGHGLCDVYHTCHCADTWSGADCSLRTCPFGNAWSDTVASLVENGRSGGHFPAECSGKGLCDRKNAACACQEGFEGSACERRSCANRCSGRGACADLEYFAARADPGAGTVYGYADAWDARMLRSCDCAEGFFGHDCSRMECPRGDDPFTLSGANEVQQVTCEGETGSVMLAFRGEWTRPIPHDAAAIDVRDALLELSAFKTVRGDEAFADEVGVLPEAMNRQASGGALAVLVVDGSEWCGHPPHTTEIKFLQDFGNVPLVVPDARGLGYANFPSREGRVAVVEKARGTKENAWCSNRGLCDTETGRCVCDQDKWDSSDGYGNRGTRGDCGVAVDLPILDCPGEVPCSGHGACRDDAAVGEFPEFACECQAGWTSSDCSERTCPFGRTWYGRPTAEDEAHVAYEECSGFGLCDRADASCACAPGFTGSSCQYTLCPSATPAPCNGNGQCKTMAMLAEAAGFAYRKDVNDPFAWDAEMVRGCDCDAGFSGFDCSLKTCVEGDDPLTPSVVETRECSGRGLCDYEKGACECFEGYGASDGRGNKGEIFDCGFVLSILPGVL